MQKFFAQMKHKQMPLSRNLIFNEVDHWRHGPAVSLRIIATVENSQHEQRATYRNFPNSTGARTLIRAPFG